MKIPPVTDEQIATAIEAAKSQITNPEHFLKRYGFPAQDPGSKAIEAVVQAAGLQLVMLIELQRRRAMHGPLLWDGIEIVEEN